MWDIEALRVCGQREPQMYPLDNDGNIWKAELDCVTHRKMHRKFWESKGTQLKKISQYRV